MEIRYVNSKNQVQTLTINAGDSWKDIKCDNPYLKNIGLLINKNGGRANDEYVSYAELKALSTLLAQSDKYIQGRKSDNVAQLDELKILEEKLKDGGIRLKQKHKISEFSKENLEKIYPKDKFDYVEKQDEKYETNKTLYVYPKGKTDKPVMTIKSFGDEQNIEVIDFDTRYMFYTGKSELTYKTEYGNRYTTEELTQKLVLAISKRLPVANRNNILTKLMTHINEDNIYIIIDTYKELTGKDIEEHIKDTGSQFSFDIDKNMKTKLLEHIKKCAEKHDGYNTNFRNDHSKVPTTKYYEGDEYSVVQKGDVMRITNKKTKASTELDLEKLFDGYSRAEKTAMKKEFQELPGEVLMDLSNEVESIKGQDSVLGKLASFMGKVGDFLHLSGKPEFGSFHPLSNRMHVKAKQGKRVILHELGHAIDNKILIFSTALNTKFCSAYVQEMKEFKKNNKNSSPYCTENRQEMFAESYVMLMTGIENPCIAKYFPKTLETVKELLKETRNSSKYVRNLY